MMLAMDCRCLPKAELHLHIEGTLEPELAFTLAERNGLTLPWASVDELRAHYDFADLSDFLDLYYAVMTVLRQRQDFFDLAQAYLERAWADGVRHAELSFDPQVHLDHEVPLAEVVGGLSDALAVAQRDHGMSGGLILCCLRDRGPATALELLDLAEPLADRLLGIGLDSAEAGYPPGPFAPVFERAGRLGLRRTAHAGEEADASYVWGALDALGVERIDHGLRALEDDALVARLARDRIPLTLCPLSNLRLGVIASLEHYPLPELLARDIVVTVNSDDPAYFGGYLGDNLALLQATLGLADETMVRLCRNSVEASFATAQRKTELLDELDRGWGG
jgi:adenosine deaminase